MKKQTKTTPAHQALGAAALAATRGAGGSIGGLGRELDGSIGGTILGQIGGAGYGGATVQGGIGGLGGGGALELDGSIGGTGGGHYLP
jgi:hypothetical protein